MNDNTDFIEIFGARENNLKNIDLKIPRNKLTVITGLSGSGKSSLAFDTIYAEGQRRYIETFSSYIRQFIGSIERPDVDKISGLSPVISIEQKTTNKNPRSTVGTITEIYDYLRLLYAKVADAHSYITGKKMTKYTDEQIINSILENNINNNIIVLAPIIKGRKGHYKELFEQIRKKGYLKARIDNEITDLKPGHKVERFKAHNIEIVIDKINCSNTNITRLKSSINSAISLGRGNLIILNTDINKDFYFSKHLMCSESGISYDEPAPHSFSFNSPHGACPNCNGLGEVSDIDINKIIPDKNLSIKNGAISPLGKYKSTLIFWQIESILDKHNIDLDTPVEEISDEIINIILNGTDEVFKLKNSPLGSDSNYFLSFDGVMAYLNKQFENSENTKTQNNILIKKTCPLCNGKRLKKESLYFLIDNKNISDVSSQDISELYTWSSTLIEKLDSKKQKIANEILKEINERISFLLDVGLNYLSLNRSSASLSGGESQRIRLASQIGSKLVNVLYILDEPSIGLHQKDNIKLIDSLKKLRDTGNTVIVVEHDKDMIEAADFIVDIGPGAGEKGGYIVAAGTYSQILHSNSITADYLNGRKEIKIPVNRRIGNGNLIKITGAKGNNLKNINVELPLGTFICITGVSGSGKSTLINETLYPYLSKKFYRALKQPLEFDKIDGIENIDKVIDVDQSPIGLTPRSNPATYTGIFTEIRKFFEFLPESKIRGYKAGRFSFNVKGGRCETCGGAGLKTIEMNFLPDVHVNCESCNGRRYNKETLEVRYKGKSICDILDLTINEAEVFFKNFPKIYDKLSILKKVGLGYITLGQSSITLSGGEAQRVKLATELAKKDTGKTLYILDEPTTGLHFEDIKVLLDVLNLIVDKGNTVIVIEHNIDVIKIADYIIDLGTDGGKNGGNLIFQGVPDKLVRINESYTAQFLSKELKKLTAV